MKYVKWLFSASPALFALIIIQVLTAFFSASFILYANRIIYTSAPISSLVILPGIIIVLSAIPLLESRCIIYIMKNNIVSLGKYAYNLKSLDGVGNKLKFITICGESSSYVASIFSAPFSCLIFLFVYKSEMGSIGFEAFLATIPIFISFSISRLKIKFTKNVVDSSRERSKKYSEWLENKTEIDFPLKIFKEELSYRKKDTFSDESMNYIPIMVLILSILYFYSSEVIDESASTLLFFFSIYVLHYTRIFFDSLALISRAEKHFLASRMNNERRSI
ncbi:hypothetical protein CBF23_005985 [Marinomonas agarivorans]|nr:hypothetical protein CBF23_005985 [Marinomonas agarivorans]